MKTARTLFLISRTHGLKAHLLRTQDYNRLLGTRDLQGLADYLSAKDYSSELRYISTLEITAVDLERVFYEKLSTRWYSLLGVSSGRTRELLEAHNERLEVENLKKVIRAVHRKEAAGTELFTTVPRRYQNVNLRALSAAKSMSEVAGLLRETLYQNFVQWLGEYDTYDNPIILEAQLDKTYYTDYWNKAQKNPDCNKIRDLIGTEIDVRNLHLILSAKHMKLDSRLVQRMTIPLGHKLQRSVVSRLGSANLQGIPLIALWPSYSALTHQAVELINEDRLVEMETLLRRYFNSYIERIALRNPNSLSYVFSYLSLCLKEARNLTTLAIGKEMKITQESLRGLLI